MISPVCLPTREANWALRLAGWMAEHAVQEQARSESIRLRNTIREGLTGVADHRRALGREQRRKYRERHPERLLEYNRRAQRKRRARQRGEAA